MTWEPIRIDFSLLGVFRGQCERKRKIKLKIFKFLTFMFIFSAPIGPRDLKFFLVGSQMMPNKMQYTNEASLVWFGMIQLSKLVQRFLQNWLLRLYRVLIQRNILTPCEIHQDNAFKPKKSKINRYVFSGQPFFKILAAYQIRPNQTKSAQVVYYILLGIV